MLQSTTQATKTVNRRIVINASGGPEVLQIAETPMENPAPGSVRIQVEAAGITYHDLMERRGLREPGSTTKIPFTPGVEVAGVINMIGSDVNGLQIGQRVVAAVDRGGYGSYVNVLAWRCIPVPDSVDPRLAAAAVVNYWTAYHILHNVAHMQAGQRILVHGGGGGLGIAAIQLARVIGAEIYATASAPKHVLIRSLGATPIDYKTEDFVARVHALTPGGVDLVIDTVGPKNLPRSFRALASKGMLVMAGALDSSGGIVPMIPSIAATIIRGLLPGGRQIRLVFLNPAHNRASYLNALPILMSLLQSGQIAPVIGAEFPLEQAAEAHRTLESAKVSGKILLIP